MLLASPYRMSLAEIRRMTRAQLRELVFVPRDEWGNVRRGDAPPAEGKSDPEAALRRLCLGRGWPGWLAEKWLAKLGADDGPFAQVK